MVLYWSLNESTKGFVGMRIFAIRYVFFGATTLFTIAGEAVQSCTEMNLDEAILLHIGHGMSGPS